MKRTTRDQPHSGVARVEGQNVCRFRGLCQEFHRLVLCKISVLPAADTLGQLRVDRTIDFVRGLYGWLAKETTDSSSWLFEFQQFCWLAIWACEEASNILMHCMLL